METVDISNPLTSSGFSSEWAAFGPAPHISSTVFSEVCLNRLGSWITQCQSHHPDCVVPVGSVVPSRLLKLSLNKWPWRRWRGPLKIKLIETNPERIYRYVALSHVWSLSKPLKTMRNNVADHRRRVSLKDISDVFKDTLVLSFTLGFRYVWIDSLCIVQDDESDWSVEIQRMGAIYSNAHVVFAAHGQNLGLFKEPLRQLQDPFRPDDNPVFCRTKLDHHWISSPPDDEFSWRGRAWCMQERILGPRILHFGGSFEEILFECNTHTQCECGRMPESASNGLKMRFTTALRTVGRQIDSTPAYDEFWQTYIAVCEDYTSRGLTVSHDTLPAVSGLMRRLSPFLGKYYSGLWEKNLIVGLQWEAVDTRGCKRHPDYVAPTFSWASRSGAVIWYIDKTPTCDTHEFAEVIECSCTLAGTDPFGKVSGGFIKIGGYTAEMVFESTLKHPPDGRMKLWKPGAEPCYVVLDSVDDSDEALEGKSVMCLDIMRDKPGQSSGRDPYVSALILLPDESREGCYRRIGLSTMRVSHFQAAKRENVTII
jgi:Heterokaryon incompatibility protein (HET)